MDCKDFSRAEFKEVICKTICCICLENSDDMCAANPCGHVSACSTCKKDLNACPICRQQVIVILGADNTYDWAITTNTKIFLS